MNLPNMITSLLNRHFWAVLIALAIAVFSVAPQLFFMTTDQYAGIDMFGTDAEHFYLSRVYEVSEGHATIANPYQSTKDQPYLYPILGENLIARTGTALSLSVSEVNVLLKAILPPLMFLLIYALVLSFFKRRSIAVLSASSILLGYNLLDGPQHVLDLLTLSSQAASFLPYTRFPHPGLSSFFLFGSIFLLYRLLFKREDVASNSFVLIGALGLLSGSTIYIYIYPWAFLLTFMGLLGFFALYKKKFKKVISIFSAIGISILVTIPYWLNVISAQSHIFYEETSARIGLVATHAPIFSLWLFIATIAVLFLWPKEYRNMKYFFVLFTLALWVVLNQQIITGMELHHAHFHFYIVKPFVSIVLVMLFVYWTTRILKGKYAIVPTILAVFVLFLNGYIIQVNSYERYELEFTEHQRYGSLISFLTNRYEEPQSIWTTPDTSLFLSMYTNHYFPNHNSLGYSLGSNEYLLQRLFLGYKLRGVTPEEILEVLQEERRGFSKRTFLMEYRQSLGSYEAIPDKAVRKVADAYSPFYEKTYPDIFDILGLDIVIEDTANENLPYEDIQTLTQIGKVGDFIIYEIL